MRNRYFWIALILVALVSVGSAVALVGSPRFEIALIEDFPYNAEQRRMAEVLFEELNNEDLAFIAHVGDIKGDEDCDDEIYLREKERFDSSENPLVYVPGDNEWTDCDDEDDSYAPIEALQRLREIFFQGEESLGTETIPLLRQSVDYPENVRWTYGDVTFLTLSISGSNNNLGLTPEGDAEYAARNEANLQWLRQGFDAAEVDESAAVVIFIQANPDFDRPPEDRTGHEDFLAALEEVTVAFGKPVALVHGDTRDPTGRQAHDLLIQRPPGRELHPRRDLWVARRTLDPGHRRYPGPRDLLLPTGDARRAARVTFRLTRNSRNFVFRYSAKLWYAYSSCVWETSAVRPSLKASSRTSRGARGWKM